MALPATRREEGEALAVGRPLWQTIRTLAGSPLAHRSRGDIEHPEVGSWLVLHPLRHDEGETLAVGREREPVDASEFQGALRGHRSRARQVRAEVACERGDEGGAECSGHLAPTVRRGPSHHRRTIRPGSLEPVPALQERLPNRPLKGGHCGSQLGAGSVSRLGIALTRERLGDPLDERETLIGKPELCHQLGHLRDGRLSVRDALTSALHAPRPYVRSAAIGIRTCGNIAADARRCCTVSHSVPDRAATSPCLLRRPPRRRAPGSPSSWSPRPASSTSANNEPSQHSPHRVHSSSVRLGFTDGP